MPRVSEVMAAEHDEAADWAQRAVSAMARAEILDESTASGSASAPLTRRDACVMLCRAIERL